MIKKHIALIGLMAFCLAGAGAGTALALTRNAATPTVESGSFDKAVYMYWGHEQSTATLDNVEDLSAGATVYRYLTVSPQSTKSLAGQVTLEFRLSATECNYHIKGLSVKVYETASLANDSTVAGLIGSADATVDAENPTGYVRFNITSDSAHHETVKYYAIGISWTGANDSEHPTYEMSGNVRIAQSFEIGA